jgi:hypothetical protein
VAQPERAVVVLVVLAGAELEPEALREWAALVEWAVQ